MLRILLVERFQPGAPCETRDMPILALLVGKNGPKLWASDHALAEEEENARASRGFRAARRNGRAGLISADFTGCQDCG